MYYEVHDEALLRKFWDADSTSFPRFWKDASETWGTSFEEFHVRQWQTYSVDDVALVYIEPVGENANLHFSLLRGKSVDMTELLELRGTLEAKYPILFGWCLAKNRGLARLLENLDFRYDGLDMRHGSSHNQVLKYKCYTYKRKTLAPCTKSLIG